MKIREKRAATSFPTSNISFISSASNEEANHLPSFSSSSIFFFSTQAQHQQTHQRLQLHPLVITWIFSSLASHKAPLTLPPFRATPASSRLSFSSFGSSHLRRTPLSSFITRPRIQATTSSCAPHAPATKACIQPNLPPAQQCRPNSWPVSLV